MEVRPADGMPDKSNLESTSDDKATKSDEESKGSLKTLFKQWKILFTSPHRGEGVVTSPEGTEETVLVDTTREFLTQDETQLIERVDKSLMLWAELEKQYDEVEAHIQNQDFHIQDIETENVELVSKNEILCLDSGALADDQ